MRLRKKWYAKDEIEKSIVVYKNGMDVKGKWNSIFKNDNPIYLEIGCGMGKFLLDSSRINKNINYIGVDFKDEVVVNALRKIEENEVENGKLIITKAEYLENFFDKNEVQRIYINFCNPWPKRRQNNRRLTYISFLNMYKKFLSDSGEIYFKTDSDELYVDSLEYFKNTGYNIIYSTTNLNENYEDNIVTEYERKFRSLSIPIKFIRAKLEK